MEHLTLDHRPSGGTRPVNSLRHKSDLIHTNVWRVVRIQSVAWCTDLLTGYRLAPWLKSSKCLWPVFWHMQYWRRCASVIFKLLLNIMAACLWIDKGTWVPDRSVSTFKIQYTESIVTKYGFGVGDKWAACLIILELWIHLFIACWPRFIFLFSYKCSFASEKFPAGTTCMDLHMALVRTAWDIVIGIKSGESCFTELMHFFVWYRLADRLWVSTVAESDVFLATGFLGGKCTSAHFAS